MDAKRLNLNDAPCKMGDEALIRHAYEQVVTYASRLSSYATSQPLRTDGPIYERQEMLAVDDLANFAFHARRLIGFTDTQKLFQSVDIPIEKEKAVIPITRVLNIIIHQELVDTFKYKWKLQLRVAKNDSEVFKILREADKSTIPTLIAIKSDHSDLVILKLATLMELFQKNVLQKLIDICAENGLYLEDS